MDLLRRSWPLGQLLEAIGPPLRLLLEATALPLWLLLEFLGGHQ